MTGLAAPLASRGRVTAVLDEQLLAVFVAWQVADRSIDMVILDIATMDCRRCWALQMSN